MSVLVTSEIFIKRAKEKHGNKYNYSKVNYVKQDEKIILICPVHGEILMEPRNHLRSNSGCDKCKSNVTATNETFVEKAKLIHGDKYDYSLIDYKNKNSNLTIICPVHGEFKQKAKYIIGGFGCQKCSWDSIGDFQRLSSEEFIQRAKLIHKDRYDYSLVNYKKIIEKVKIICSEHGEFEQRPSSHLSGYGCQKCKESKGERIIREYLESENINNTPQYKFNDCKNINQLPFDFYLPDYNICIEYNGAQHYKPVKYWGGEETLKKVKFRDKIKMEYCRDNNIPLIIIRYNEDILKKLTNLIGPETHRSIR